MFSFCTIWHQCRVIIKLTSVSEAIIMNLAPRLLGDWGPCPCGDVYIWSEKPNQTNSHKLVEVMPIIIYCSNCQENGEAPISPPDPSSWDLPLWFQIDLQSTSTKILNVIFLLELQSGNAKMNFPSVIQEVFVFTGALEGDALHFVLCTIESISTISPEKHVPSFLMGTPGRGGGAPPHQQRSRLNTLSPVQWVQFHRSTWYCMSEILTSSESW